MENVLTKQYCCNDKVVKMFVIKENNADVKSDLSNVNFKVTFSANIKDVEQANRLYKSLIDSIT